MNRESISRSSAPDRSCDLRQRSVLSGVLLPNRPNRRSQPPGHVDVAPRVKLSCKRCGPSDFARIADEKVQQPASTPHRQSPCRAARTSHPFKVTGLGHSPAVGSTAFSRSTVISSQSAAAPGSATRPAEVRARIRTRAVSPYSDCGSFVSLQHYWLPGGSIGHMKIFTRRRIDDDLDSRRRA